MVGGGQTHKYVNEVSWPSCVGMVSLNWSLNKNLLAKLIMFSQARLLITKGVKLTNMLTR